MKTKIISILTLLPMLLAVFLFTNIQNVEATDNNIKEVYYNTNNYITDRLISVQTPTDYEYYFGPEYLSYRTLLESNPNARYNVYQYLYEREEFQREKTTSIKTYNKININEVYKTTIYTNGSSVTERVQRYESYLSTYTTSSVSYTPYKFFKKHYRSETRLEYY